VTTIEHVLRVYERRVMAAAAAAAAAAERTCPFNDVIHQPRPAPRRALHNARAIVRSRVIF